MSTPHPYNVAGEQVKDRQALLAITDAGWTLLHTAAQHDNDRVGMRQACPFAPLPWQKVVAFRGAQHRHDPINTTVDRGSSDKNGRKCPSP